MILRWLQHNALSTWWYTRRRGEFVGEDDFGNRYYRNKGAKSRREERRWVVFSGAPDPTMVPPGWYGWLHKRIDLPPSERPLPHPRYEKEHLPNLTGTALAYVPEGHLKRGGHRAPATGDYEAWRP
ncbi:MAG: NADH:ubiquinone oxidoreductase subunit NDUFA12 [Geminicoccaceae bacterium]